MKKYFFILIALTAFLAPARVFSQTDSSLKTLSGFDTLKVEIENLAPDLEQAGLKKEQIQTDIETKLRAAGLKIKKPTDSINPYVVLHVSVNSIDNGVGGFAVSINSSLNQIVILDRNKSLATVAGTWESRSIVSVIKEKVQAIRNFVGIQIDLFVKSYQKANAAPQKQNSNLPPS